MSDYIEEECPNCGQKLRFPTRVGGITMQCPNCDQKFYSDFKIGKVGNKSKCNKVNRMGQRGACNRGTPRIFTEIFEMPYKLVRKIIRMFKG